MNHQICIISAKFQRQKFQITTMVSKNNLPKKKKKVKFDDFNAYKMKLHQIFRQHIRYYLGDLAGA